LSERQQEAQQAHAAALAANSDNATAATPESQAVSEENKTGDEGAASEKKRKPSVGEDEKEAGDVETKKKKKKESKESGVSNGANNEAKSSPIPWRKIIAKTLKAAPERRLSGKALRKQAAEAAGASAKDLSKAELKEAVKAGVAVNPKVRKEGSGDDAMYVYGSDN
jgi:hypothetical protein